MKPARKLVIILRVYSRGITKVIELSSFRLAEQDYASHFVHCTEVDPNQFPACREPFNVGVTQTCFCSVSIPLCVPS